MDNREFEKINQAYNNTFKINKLSLGIAVPIDNQMNSPIPSMKKHIELIQYVEELGFSAIWVRDIPFNVPSFNDAGQMYDPFVYLGFLAAQTKKISLAVGSVILPLRHPAHIAKSAASIDDLSNGRLLLGIASGDRIEEYPALNIPYENRGDKFRESYKYIKEVWKDHPMFDNEYGSPYGGLDMLPKPVNKKVPMLITGASQQSPEWLATNGDGWITYPRKPEIQNRYITQWRSKGLELGLKNKPVSQSMYIDLDDDFKEEPQAIHLGYRLNTDQLKELLNSLQNVGVNHVALNLRFNKKDIKTTLELLAQKVLPDFS